MVGEQEESGQAPAHTDCVVISLNTWSVYISGFATESVFDKVPRVRK